MYHYHCHCYYQSNRCCWLLQPDMIQTTKLTDDYYVLVIRALLMKHMG